MQHKKLTSIANRQLDYSVRDVAFGALMALVIAVMLLAFTTTGSIARAAAPAPEPAPYTLADTAAEIEAHTAQACGDITPVVEPAC